MPLSQVSEGSERVVVIVDDDIDLARIYQEVLEQAGYRVFTATDGVQALELLSRLPSPELLLVDCLMPEMNGIEFLRELKSRNPEVFQKTSIIGLTGLYSENKLLEQMQPLVSRVVEKPSDIDELVELVRSTVG